jgi:hypothetical protein
VQDKPRSGRPCMSKMEENVTKVRTLVRSGRHMTVTMIGSELNLNHQTVNDILTEELGSRTLGCCITTTFPVTLPFPWTTFWPKSVFQWFRSSLTSLIWVRVTSSFSLNSKFYLKCRHLGILNNIQKVVTDQLMEPPHEDFQHCYREWEQLRRCVASQTNYFEGDDVNF